MTAAPARRPRAARVWGETWRVLVAALIGFTGFVLVAWEVDAGDRVVTDPQWTLDLLVGVLGLPLLLLRRRVPLTVTLVLCAASSVSVAVSGALMIAFVSLATRRRWWQIGLVLVASTVASWVYGMVHPPVDPEITDTVVNLAVGVVGFALLAWIGAYIGLRREHLESLRERAETAEREQASRVAQARATERARIAREMHDVLAHRMSLVAMHAGALAYRTDLPPEKVAETAAVVRTNAHAALVELREVLGVLRDPLVEPVEARPEPPQPTLDDLEELLAQARANGVEVRLDHRVDDVDGLGEAASRHAYRIVQEGLTNARKHAPWAAVTVTLAGAPDDGLSVSVRNPVRSVGPVRDAGPARPGPDSGPAAPPSGLGLLGLTERAELVGGRLSYGPTADGRDGRGVAFLLEAWLPWAP